MNICKTYNETYLTYANSPYKRKKTSRQSLPYVSASHQILFPKGSGITLLHLIIGVYFFTYRHWSIIFFWMESFGYGGWLFFNGGHLLPTFYTLCMGFGWTFSDDVHPLTTLSPFAWGLGGLSLTMSTFCPPFTPLHGV